MNEHGQAKLNMARWKLGMLYELEERQFMVVEEDGEDVLQERY